MFLIRGDGHVPDDGPAVDVFRPLTRRQTVPRTKTPSCPGPEEKLPAQPHPLAAMRTTTSLTRRERSASEAASHRPREVC